MSPNPPEPSASAALTLVLADGVTHGDALEWLCGHPPNHEALAPALSGTLGLP